MKVTSRFAVMFAALSLMGATCGDDGGGAAEGSNDGMHDSSDHTTHDGGAGDAGVHGGHDAAAAGDGDGDSVPSATTDMALKFVPCPDDLPEFSIDMEATGDMGAVTARLTGASPAPPEKFKNDWTLLLLDADGNPLDDVVIDSARPWMPAHQHDGTFPPTIEALDEPGMFQVDALNLWMRGHWEVQFEVTSESAGEDFIVFDVCIDE